MPKRSDTIETVLLALELLRRIPRGRSISASELHVQLGALGMERDVRTIQRQLSMLSEHFDIERDDSSKPYGYRWKANSPGLALPMLGEQESVLLTLAEQHLRNLLPARLMKSMEGFFEQARVNLKPHAGAKRGAEWLSKVRVVSATQPLLPPTIRPGVFEAVSNALYGNRWLQVEYMNANGERSARDVMPLGLAQQGARLYLVCRYRDFANERSLAVHRIISALVTEFEFVRPADFNLQKFDDDGRFGFGEGKRIKLTFQIDKSAGLHLTESPLSLDQKIRDLGDRYAISATVMDTAQLLWWLRGFGDQVTHVRRSRVLTGREDRSNVTVCV